MISIIAAVDRNLGIGFQNKLLYWLPNDLKRFKALTTGNTIIMGRKTFESIGKPLPNRENIVLSKNGFIYEGIKVYSKVEELLKTLNDEKKNYIIGGAGIYKELLPLVDILHISHVKGTFEGDAYFPKVNYDDYEILEKIEYEEFTYIKYRKKSIPVQMERALKTKYM